MSELPEAVGDWPREPHRVLGVESDADAKAVKRAYAKLLRRFPPDEFPAHFERLNEAKEWLLDRAQSAPAFGSEWFAESEEDAVPGPDDDPPEDPSEDEPARRPAADEEVAALWRTAVEGDPKAAYGAATALMSERPRAALAAYWLLRTDPSLDPSRKPADCLLAAAAVEEPPPEWVRQVLAELVFRPVVSLEDRLAAAVARPEVARALLPVRWSEACNAGRFDLVEADLSRLEWVDPEARLELCRLALRRVCLFFDEDARRLTGRLTAEVGDVTASESRWLEVELAEEVDRLRDESTGPAYTSLLRLLATWPAGVRDRREHLRPILSGWWRKPAETLPRLDDLYGTAPVLLMTWTQRLGDLLDPDVLGRDARKAAVAALSAELPSCQTYAQARTLLLRVCRTYLLPSTHIPWWHGVGRELPSERWPLVEALGEDTPLALLTTAWCVHVFE